MRKNFLLNLFIAALVFAHCGSSAAATVEQETLAHVANLKAIKSGQPQATIQTYNKQMDAAWKFFYANKTQVLPVLQAELKDELTSPQPSDLVLLDIGMFVYKNGDDDGKKLGGDALLKLNPHSPLVQENFQELFDFTYSLARAHDPRTLPIIDTVFLPSNQDVFVPQHALRLDGTLVCVFLYGVSGTDVDSRLRGKLADKPLDKRVLEILTWLGSPASLPDVRNAVMASPDYETFSRATTYMMRSAGPEGRSYMLGVDAHRLDAQSQKYLAQILPGVRKSSFKAFKQELVNLPGDTKLSDAEVAARLQAMVKNAGRDDETSPLAILNSSLPAETLINELVKVRSSTLQRLSNEALGDVEVTNYLINALRYRMAGERSSGK